MHPAMHVRGHDMLLHHCMCNAKKAVRFTALAGLARKLQQAILRHVSTSLLSSSTHHRSTLDVVQRHNGSGP